MKNFGEISVQLIKTVVLVGSIGCLTDSPHGVALNDSFRRVLRRCFAAYCRLGSHGEVIVRCLRFT